MSNYLMLCKSDLDRFLNDNKGRDIIISPKLDGVRCATKIIDNEIVYLSRSNKQFPNFAIFDDVIKEIMRQIYKEITVPTEVYRSLNLSSVRNSIYHKDIIVDFLKLIRIDGEVIAKDSDFSKVMTQVRRLKEANPEIFEFQIFDIFLETDIPDYMKLCDAFNKIPFKDRFQILKVALDKLAFTDCDYSRVKLVRHDRIKSKYVTTKDIINLCDYYIDTLGHEGLVLKDAYAPYEIKKSKHWCKIKRTYTVDLQVLEMIEGTGKYVGMMGALRCQQTNGETVKVGTGFTDDERTEFYSAIPAMIEAKYQEVTADGSLRFPAFVRVREDK